MSNAASTTIDSKSAKKRKAKTSALTEAAVSGLNSTNSTAAVNGSVAHDSASGADSPYLRELSKNIRNINKKIAGTAKTDAIIEQNPGASLDDLLAQKKINADQKAQVLKKPQLQSQLTQLEEQHKHYQTFAQEMEDKFTRDKAALTETHEAELAKAREDAAEAAEKSQVSSSDDALKVITGFLHAAAAKRQQEDDDSEEARAFEGALLLVYQGNSAALNTLKNLVEGPDEKVPDVEGNPRDYTYAQIKAVALKGTETAAEEPEAETEPAVNEQPPPYEVGTDPTIANAGLTELEDNTSAVINGAAEPEIQSAIPEQASVTADAANAVAEANWDPQASITSAQTPTGEDWVQVPRDPAETETGATVGAGNTSTSNWADEAGAAAAEEKPVAENDGFEQVRRDRGGRGRGRGGRGFDGRGRGRGRGDGYRGRGGPGRGRGGPRGDRAPQAS